MIYIIHDPNNCPSPCLGAYGQLLPRGGMRCRAACAHPCSALPTCFCSSPPLPGCRHPLFPDRVDDPSLSIVLPHSVFHTRWQILRQLKRGLSFPPNVVRYCPLSGSVQLADFRSFLGSLRIDLLISAQLASSSSTSHSGHLSRLGSWSFGPGLVPSAVVVQRQSTEVPTILRSQTGPGSQGAGISTRRTCQIR